MYEKTEIGSLATFAEQRGLSLKGDLASFLTKVTNSSNLGKIHSGNSLSNLRTPQEDLLLGGTHNENSGLVSKPDFYRPLALTHSQLTLNEVEILRKFARYFLLGLTSRQLGYENLAISFAPLDETGQTMWDPIVAGPAYQDEKGTIILVSRFKGKRHTETEKLYTLFKNSSIDLGLRPELQLKSLSPDPLRGQRTLSAH